MAVADASLRTEKLAISFGLINDSGFPTPAGVTTSKGIPSITISGLLFAERDAPPRILIFGAASGAPPLLVITTPATFPVNNWSDETIAPWLKSSAVMLATEPVASFTVVVPYPITTTSFNSEADSISVTFKVAPAMFTSCVSKPKDENTKTWPLAAVIV